MSNKTKILLILGVTVVAIAALYGSYAAGLSRGDRGSSISIITSNDNESDVDLAIFWDVVGLIQSRYFKASEMENRDILYGAIKGVVDSLDDPYSSFFEPSDAEKFEQDITGSFGGVGMEIGIRDDQLVVLAPLKGNPAYEVGLKAGDKILQADDTPTSGLSIDESVKIIRGEVGTEVTLLIFREGWDEPKEFKIIRRIIQVPTLDWEILDDKIAYIQLYSFNANASSLFYEASFSALFKGPKGVILDLRNNSGGFLDVAVDIAGWFLKRGDLVVQEKFPSGKTQDFIANGSGAWRNLPVVVLVNGGSASASEIVAGALRDHLGAELIGEKTFGKGTVQEIESLSDGSKLKISIAEWLTPNGSIINERGLEPDIKIEFTDEDIEEGRDVQLEKALELMKEKAKNVKSIQTILL